MAPDSKPPISQNALVVAAEVFANPHRVIIGCAEATQQLSNGERVVSRIGKDRDLGLAPFDMRNQCLESVGRGRSRSGHRASSP